MKLKVFKKLLRNEIINVLKENAVPDHDGKSAPFGSGYKKMNELDDNEGQMAKAQLERSMEYSKMIYDFMIDFGGDSDKLQFPAWVQSKLTKSMDYLQSVYNYLDGKDGLADDPSALRKKQESHVYGHDDEDSKLNEASFAGDVSSIRKGLRLFKIDSPKTYKILDRKFKLTKILNVLNKLQDYMDDVEDGKIKLGESKLNEDVFKSFLRDDPAFKLYTAKNTDNRKSVMARKTDRTFDDGVPVLKFIARAPKKPAPLPKGSFKIIEDNKHGWWYYQVGSTWYGIRQKDYGTPPFEY